VLSSTAIDGAARPMTPPQELVGAIAPLPSEEAVRAALIFAWNGAGWLDGRLAGSLPLENYSQPSWGATLDAAMGVAAVDRAFGSDHASPERVVEALRQNRDAVLSPGGTDNPGLLGKAILLIKATGGDPAAFGPAPGADLLARLLATIRTSGADAGLFGSADPLYDGATRQGLAMRALSTAGVAVPAAAADWLEAQQCADGSWQAYRADPSAPCVLDAANFSGPDTNSTALAVMGLVAAGRTGATGAAAAGVDWLLSVINADLGWGYFEGSDSDTNSSALGIQAVASLTGFAAILQSAVRTGAFARSASVSLAAALEGTPAFLATVQIPCDAQADPGAFDYQLVGGTLSANLLATAQATAALAFDGSLQPSDQPASDTGLGVPAKVCAEIPAPAPTPTSTTTTTTAVPSTTTTAAAPRAETTSSTAPVGVAATASAASGATGAGGTGPTALAVTGSSSGPLGGLGATMVALGLALCALGAAARRRGHDEAAVSAR
jgi:hypothetical protein